MAILLQGRLDVGGVHILKEIRALVRLTRIIITEVVMVEVVVVTGGGLW